MSLLPIQTQAFLLYGSGVVIGNTSITLSSFLDINGNQITMQGTVMTGTAEPNSGAQEEQVIFTGVTVNSNGTTTLTGISSVGFASPYTQTSGFIKSHAGNTAFVLSDTAYLYSQYANLQNTQTFTGTNTFNIAPVIPTVASSATTQAASVGYVNSISIAGAPKASATVIGITELSVNPVTASVPIAVGTNDSRIPTASEALALIGDGGTPSNTNLYITQQGYQIGTENFAVTGGSSTAYTIGFTPSTAGLGYTTGERIYFKTNVASGASPTINKDSNGAKSLYKMTSTGTTGLVVGDLGTNQMAVAEYDGGAYHLISPVANYLPSFLSTLVTSSVNSTQNIDTAITCGFTPKVIQLFYYITGVTNNVASYSQGVALFNNVGTLISNSYTSQNNAVNTYTPNMVNTNPVAGIAVGVSGIVTLSVLSVSSTGCTIRVNNVDSGSGATMASKYTVLITA